MSGRSVNLTTLFLGRLRPPKQLTSTSCTYFRQWLTTASWVAQSVGHLTRKSGVLGSIPGLATYFRFSFRFFKKGSCQLLAKVCARSTRLGGLSLPRKSVGVRLTDRPNMTLDVYRGRKTTIQQRKLPFLKKRKEKRKYVARPGIKPRTPDLRVRCPTDCATRPSTFLPPKVDFNLKIIRANSFISRPLSEREANGVI